MLYQDRINQLEAENARLKELNTGLNARCGAVQMQLQEIAATVVQDYPDAQDYEKLPEYIRILVARQVPALLLGALQQWLEAMERRSANSITAADTRLASHAAQWLSDVENTAPHGVLAAVEVLNRAVKHDPEGMLKLVEHRVPAVPGMREDPTIQCIRSTPGAAPEVGMLGILNGIFGVKPDGTGWIGACFDDTGSKLLGFKVAKQEP